MDDGREGEKEKEWTIERGRRRREESKRGVEERNREAMWKQ